MKKNISLKILLALVAALVCLPLPAQKFDPRNLNANDWIDAGKNMVEAVRPMKEDEEIQLGRSLAARLAGTFGVWKDEAWTEQINLIGRTLVPYSKRSKIKYRFAILNTNDVNAYSAPGGYVFISKGLLQQLDSEAELAGVLAHEIAHVANKDVLREIQNSNLWKAGAKVAIAGSNLSGEQEELLNNLTNASWDTLVVKGLSKEDEFKADADGVANAQKLGYDPYGLSNFLTRLEPMEKKPGENVKVFFGTHPKPSARVEKLKAIYDKEGCAAGSLPDFSDKYKSLKTAHPIS